MGWFSKKEEVPEVEHASSRINSIPELPSFPNQQKKDSLPELPSFPNNASSQNLNQEIVKSAVSDLDSSPEEDNEVESQEVVKTLPKKEIFQNTMNIPSKKEMNSPIPSPPKRIEQPKITPKIMPGKNSSLNDDEPIFVRLDKFQSAQKSLDTIMKRISEIDFTIKEIKEVKDKEDEELSKWAKETEELKSLVSKIDDEIFGKI